MTSYTKLIDDTLFNNAVKELNNINKYAKIALRLQSIISSKKNNISQTAKFLGFDRTVVAKWIKRFRDHGIDGLEDRKGRGRKSIFTKEINDELQKILESKSSNITLKKIKLEIEKKFNISPSKSAIHNHVKSLGYSHITARPVHYKQDKEKLEEFKKNSNQNKRK